jgi:hypothetical protein
MEKVWPYSVVRRSIQAQAFFPRGAQRMSRGKMSAGGLPAGGQMGASKKLRQRSQMGPQFGNTIPFKRGGQLHLG